MSKHDPEHSALDDTAWSQRSTSILLCFGHSAFFCHLWLCTKTSWKCIVPAVFFLFASFCKNIISLYYNVIYFFVTVCVKRDLVPGSNAKMDVQECSMVSVFNSFVVSFLKNFSPQQCHNNTQCSLISGQP